MVIMKRDILRKFLFYQSLHSVGGSKYAMIIKNVNKLLNIRLAKILYALYQGDMCIQDFLLKKMVEASTLLPLVRHCWA